MSLIDDLKSIQNLNTREPNQKIGVSRANDSDEKIRKIEAIFKSFDNEDSSDDKMIIKTLERISELSEMIRERVIEGERTRSWQESKIYVSLDSMESIMSGFPVRKDFDND